MNRPYIICHMTASIDGKVTGGFLSAEESASAIDVYYQINRAYKADAYACGRVTMQGSFCGDDAPDLTPYSPEAFEDHISAELSGFYAVSFDPHGRLAWKQNRIDDRDKDPGYDGAQIIEVLTEQTDPRYLAYLKSRDISYILAGRDSLDVGVALGKLKDIFGISTLLLEGGSILDGAFAEADAVDEISLVVCPVVADTEDKPLFMKSKMSAFTLSDVKQYEGGVLWLNYKK